MKRKKGEAAKPIVAITMGDPAGVGPEVVLKALERQRLRRACHPLIVGDPEVLRRTQRRIKSSLRLAPWEKGEPVAQHGNIVPVHAISRLSERQSRPGHPSRACGAAAYRAVATAVELVLSGLAAAIATAPINKEVLHLAGYRYPGHTELLAEMTGTREVRMMLLGRRLKVVLVTVHLPLVRVSSALSRKRVATTLVLAHRALRDYFRITRPRLAVAGLNPHAGEGGLFGREERRIITPAVEAVRRLGIRAHGPLPADSLFYRAVRGEYDAVVCMYHDQGLGPLKLIHFSDGVNLTLGLPIVRTSVDHGTGYEIAGKNRADATSMGEAVLLASRLARRKQGAAQ